MKLQKLRSAMLLFILAAGLTTTSCKSKTNDNNTNSSTNVDTAASTTPMDTSGAATNTSSTATDDSLRTQLEDATKDYPNVTATVDNGEVTLTGTISRAKLPKMMQSVHALNPKKVNNNLTIK